LTTAVTSVRVEKLDRIGVSMIEAAERDTVLALRF